MKILVTGASGYIGRYVLSGLQGRGHEVHAVSTQAHVSKAGVNWEQADLLQPGQAERLMERVKPEALIHLAWYAKHGSFWAARENFAWADATCRLVEAFGRSGGRRVVLAGTCAEYDWSYGYCSEDVTPTSPLTIYGKCKDATRQFVQSYSKALGLSYAWARIFFPYGPGESNGKLIPSVLEALREGRPVQCTHGRQFRDFVHVSDVASALVHLALDTNESGAFNVCSGAPVQLSRIVELCASHFPDHGPIQFGSIEAAPNDPPMLVGSRERLSVFGWTPGVPLADGIASYAALYLRSITRNASDAG